MSAGHGRHRPLQIGFIAGPHAQERSFATQFQLDRWFSQVEKQKQMQQLCFCEFGPCFCKCNVILRSFCFPPFQSAWNYVASSMPAMGSCVSSEGNNVSWYRCGEFYRGFTGCVKYACVKQAESQCLFWIPVLTHLSVWSKEHLCWWWC